MVMLMPHHCSFRAGIWVAFKIHILGLPNHLEPESALRTATLQLRHHTNEEKANE